MYYNRKSTRGWAICIFLLLFIFSPVLSAQPDAHPGSPYVVAIVIPTLVLALSSGIIKKSNTNLYAVLLFIFALLSTLVSDYGGFDSSLLKYLVFVLFFISISSFVLAPNQLKFSFTAYLYLSIALSFLIILSYIFGYPHIESTHYQGRYSIGITGLFKNPNYLTSFYNVAFFILFYILVTVKINLRKSFLLYVILASFLISSFFSGTRAALLVEFLVFLSIPLVLAKRGLFYKIIPFAVILIGVIIFYWTTLMDLYDLFMGSRDMIGDTGREEAWTYAFKYIKENLLLGCGHNSWNTIRKGTSYLEYLHNVFIELFLDQGIIGLLFAIGIIFSGYKRTNQSDRSFLKLLLLFTAIPLFFQNGLYEVNYWRFIVINRLMMNVSASYKGGINAFFQSSFGVSSIKNKQAISGN